MIRIDNVTLFTGEELFSEGTVLVDNGRIVYAGPYAGSPWVPNCDQLNGKGGILMPGFYNAHCHAAMTLMRGVGSDLTLMNWLGQIFPIEDKLTPDIVYWGTMLAIQEMIGRGVVGFADMYFFMDEVARAAIETGVRVNIVRGCTDREGVDSVPELHERWNGAGDGRVKVYMGVHGEYTTTPEVVRRAVARARELGAGIHVHVSETKGEVEGCYARRGVSPVRYFSDLGAFDGPAIAAHCVHLSEEDIAILAEKGVYVAHNPASNLKLASGIAPVAQCLKAGVRVALGTDGASSNNCLDMMADMRLASILQKGAFGDPTLLSAKEALTMATRTGALALGFEDCGLLKEGMRADMILLNGQAENLIPRPDVPAAIAYAGQSANVTMTMIDGRVVYMDGQFFTFNPERVLFKVNECARKLGVI